MESVDDQGTPRTSWILVLDRSAFYPESGGQLGDIGTLGPAKIYDVRVENGVILHYADRPISVGRVSGSIDGKKTPDIPAPQFRTCCWGISTPDIGSPRVAGWIIQE